MLVMRYLCYKKYALIRMKKIDLKPLVEISHRYGGDKRYVIAGGGNTSFKTADRLWVKASGQALATITEDGFALLDRALLTVVAGRAYSSDPTMREEQVKNDLAAANLTPGRRPSVESSMHNSIAAPFVVHLHPTVVCALMSSVHAENLTREIFGKGALYIPYTDPGYLLFKRVEKGIAAHKAAHGAEPAVIFLQNHGIFVSGDTPEDIVRTYDEVVTAIGTRVTEPLPAGSREVSARVHEVIPALQAALGEKVFLTTDSELVERFAAGPESFAGASRPFTPDGIVYCKSKYIYAETSDADTIRRQIEDYRISEGHDPKVLMIRDIGLVACGDTAAEAGIITDVYTDMLKIAWLSRSFGGPHPMTPAQINFIDNWEVENYRRSVGSNNV